MPRAAAEICVFTLGRSGRCLAAPFSLVARAPPMPPPSPMPVLAFVPVRKARGMEDG